MSFPTSPSLALTTGCRVVFGAKGAMTPSPINGALQVTLPVLAGMPDESLLENADAIEEVAGYRLFRSGARLAGFATADHASDLDKAALDLYHRLFVASAGLHLHRIWNYVPQINTHTGGLENYRRFCRGRSLAFERQFGATFEQTLPAASGVGAQRGPLAVAFLASPDRPRHFENPHQIPAFHYPVEYGPRAPSFSRATRVDRADGSSDLFISGTAAIRGHATLATGNLDGQLDCTVENLATIGHIAGTGRNLGRDDGWSRSFKVYVRHAADAARVQAHLNRSLLVDTDRVSYLLADLCRLDLLVEIEATLSR